MNRYFLILIFFVGCVGNDALRTASLSEINISNLSRVQVGMKQTEVLCIMRHPYEAETYTLDPDTYDVWFYITKPGVLGQTRMVAQNLTPLIFKNGILIGEGFNYYKYLVKLYQEQDYEPPTAKRNEPEDKELEKVLQPLTMSKPSAPKPKAPKNPNSPLDEEDEKMLEESSDQDFNQT